MFRMMKSKASPKGTPELGPSAPPGGDGTASDAPLLGGDTWSLADQSAAATSTGQGQGLGSGDFVFFDEDEAAGTQPATVGYRYRRWTLGNNICFGSGFQ